MYISINLWVVKLLVSGIFFYIIFKYLVIIKNDDFKVSILEYVIFMLFVKKKFVSCYLILASLKFMVWIFEEVVDIGFRESDFC